MKNILIFKARKMMIAGLVMSVMGNRLLDGASDGLATAGIIPISWIVFIISMGKVIEFFIPIYAKILQKFSPDISLIVEDSLEIISGIVILSFSFLLPQYQSTFIIIYLLFLLFLYPVSDIADEFYGAKIAEIDTREALKFNSSLYIWLGIVGTLVASPLGALLSGVSIPGIILLNIFFTSLGMAYRIRARVIFPMSSIAFVDSDEFSVTGKKIKVNIFFKDLFTSGPASPIVNLMLQVIGGLTGHLIILWAAANSNLPAPQAMSLTLFIFGIATVLGPSISRIIATRFSSNKLLSVTAYLSLINLSWFIFYIYKNDAQSFYIYLLFIFLNVSLNRFRTVILETHRQIYFRGSQYSRIMSWSFTFGAVGTLIGVQVGYFLQAQINPLHSLISAFFAWLIVIVFFNKQNRLVSANE